MGSALLVAGDMGFWCSEMMPSASPAVLGAISGLSCCCIGTRRLMAFGTTEPGPPLRAWCGSSCRPWAVALLCSELLTGRRASHKMQGAEEHVGVRKYTVDRYRVLCRCHDAYHMESTGTGRCSAPAAASPGCTAVLSCASICNTATVYLREKSRLYHA
jgi:hypothetical protein